MVPKLQMGACFGAPPVDFLPQQDPIAYDQLIKQAETFIQTRFLPSLHNLRIHPIVHIVKVCPACSCPQSHCKLRGAGLRQPFQPFQAAEDQLPLPAEQVLAPDPLCGCG